MKIGVIADDLTGGNGTGVKLTKLGYTVATMVFYENLPSSEEINGVIIDTDSRYAKEEVAHRRVKTAADEPEKVENGYRLQAYRQHGARQHRNRAGYPSS